MLDPAWGRAGLELLGIFLLLCLNGLFALSEIAVVSSNKTRLQQLAETNPRARQTLALANEPTAFLSTVQIGITTVGILAGALSGATLSQELAVLLSAWGWPATSAEVVSFGAVVVLVTFLSLLIGELIPKSIALSNPERFAIAVTPLMIFLSWAASPLVNRLSSITEKMLWLLRVPSTPQLPVTEEEIKVLLAEGARAGVFEPMERDIVTQALQLDDISLRPVLTHRTQVHWIDVEDDAETIREKVVAHAHNAFPLCEGGVDQLVGVLRTWEVLIALEDCAEERRELDLMAIARAPVIVPLTVAPASLLSHFQEPSTEMIFAADEYGGIEGIVTPADLLYALTRGPKLDERKDDRKAESGRASAPGRDASGQDEPEERA